MRLGTLAAAAVVAAALAAPVAQATNECDSFQSCIPVAGPWVAIAAPGTAASFPVARWYLRCPTGVVGGLDAELSDPMIDLTFPGYLGAPINPGITATNEILFQGTYTGRAQRWTTFRPHIGCIPAQGGQRTPTGRAAVVPPGRPTVLRVRTLQLRPAQLLRATHTCRPGERLISAGYGVGFRTPQPPSEAQLASVQVVKAERGGRVLLSATRHGLAPGIRVDVQVQALCARGEAGP